MVFTYVNPAVAVAGGVLLLGEPFTATIAAAFVLILAGSVLASGGRRAQRDHPQRDHSQPDQPKPDQPRPDQRQPDQPRPDHPLPDQRQPVHPQPDQRQPAAAPSAASTDPDHAAAGQS
jgi:hypothetical protein